MTHDAAPHGAPIFPTACSTNMAPLTGLGLVNQNRGGDVSSPYHPPKRKIHPFNFPLCVFASLREIPAEPEAVLRRIRWCENDFESREDAKTQRGMRNGVTRGTEVKKARSGPSMIMRLLSGSSVRMPKT